MIAGNGRLPRAYSCWASVALKIHTPHREICGRWAHVPLLRLRIQRMTLRRRDVSTIMVLRLSDLLKSYLLGTTAKLQISVLPSVLLDRHEEPATSHFPLFRTGSVAGCAAAWLLADFWYIWREITYPSRLARGPF